MAYIQIILLAILGPLQLMFNALPGSDAFSKWFRNLLANAMAFPAACIMIVFAAALMGQTGEPWNISDNIGFTDSDQGVKWTAPLIFGSGGGATNPVDAIQALLGMGILLMTPKVVDMVKEWVQAPEFKYGSAIGEAVGFGYQTGFKGTGQFIGRGGEASSIYQNVARQWSNPALTDIDRLRLSQLYPEIIAEISRGRPFGRLGYALKKARGK